MKNKKPTEALLEYFPPGTTMAIVGAPEGLEEMIDSVEGYKTVLNDELPAQYTFLFEFETHEEWKDFQKSRILCIQFMDSVVPFRIKTLNPDRREEVNEARDCNKLQEQRNQNSEDESL